MRTTSKAKTDMRARNTTLSRDEDVYRWGRPDELEGRSPRDPFGSRRCCMIICEFGRHESTNYFHQKFLDFANQMASTKDKGAAAPETSECGNCAAPEGKNGVTLKPCPKCKLTSYCGRACQAAHWKAGHKQRPE
jgi:hypothetical protein